ncbi:MAG: endonuclease [Betaproteobacteria bacterium]|jgi:endonuclease/exonuclease/phosphatase family metal-dependent hydrolase|nr:endonuclease [Betaproteobacteria bacterium]NBP44204.1 endonuclease [Betaproteobacteria bacterium]
MNPIRVVTYNIHKGVRGARWSPRVELHNLSLAMSEFDADFIALQEVRHVVHAATPGAHAVDLAPTHNDAHHSQAHFLAPMGYDVVYQTNAFTRSGEHGNALLTRWPVVRHQHEDVSDHQLEQRGLLHVEVMCHAQPLHVIVVHLGLLPGSRRRQVTQLRTFIQREIPTHHAVVVAGDFNDWGPMARRLLAQVGFATPDPVKTFPSRWPVAALDQVLARRLKPLCASAPRGKVWRRMSDHLPLIVDWSWSKPLHPQGASDA